MTTIVKRVDSLGRIVIPLEVRTALKLKQGSMCRISISGNKATLENADKVCELCGKAATIELPNGHIICQKCADIISESSK